MNRKMSPHEARMLWMGRVVIWVTIIIVLFPVSCRYVQSYDAHVFGCLPMIFLSLILTH